MHLGIFSGACKWAAGLGRAPGSLWAKTTHSSGDQPKGSPETGCNKEQRELGSGRSFLRSGVSMSETGNFMG